MDFPSKTVLVESLNFVFQELEIVLGDNHISFTTSKIGSLVDVQECKDSDGLRCFYYLVQVYLSGVQTFHHLPFIHPTVNHGHLINGLGLGLALDMRSHRRLITVKFYHRDHFSMLLSV